MDYFLISVLPSPTIIMRMMDGAKMKGNSGFLFSVLLLITLLVAGDAFLVNPNNNHRTSALAAGRNSKRAPKPPRFSQAAYTPPKRAKGPKKGSANSGNNKINSMRPPKAAGSSNNIVDKDKMWKSQKSIEELEKSMENRWGTSLETWTSEHYDDDDFEIVGEVSESGELIEIDDVQNSNPMDDESPKDSPRAFFGGVADDPLLRRAQRNQNHHQEAQQQQQRQQSPKQRQSETESRSRTIRVDDMIAAEPAGGRGSSFSSGSGSKEEADIGGGFFFRSRDSEPPKTNVQTSTRNDSKDDDGTPKRKPRTAASTPILDDNGDPMILTLQQAESDFRKLVGDEVSFNEETEAVDREIGTRNWDELGIENKILLGNLNRMRCGKSLEVQDKACPLVLEGKDVLVGTYTGSGKTLAFLVPLIQKIFDQDDGSGSLRVIVVAPGRELASQIVSVARDLLDGAPHSAMLAIGGTTFGRNLEQIRKRRPSILVGTPGRIAELVVGRPGEKSGRLKVAGLSSLVLDEFDALLEYKPHRDPTNAILDTLKRRHWELQSILCSATASDMLNSPKIETYLRPDFAQAMADQDDILVTQGKKAARVSRTVLHGVVHVPHRRFALETLRKILHTDPFPRQILIFAENSRKVTIMCEKLERMGIIAAPLHGGMGSEKMDRAEVSKALREGYVGIVVATELAARGLDAPLLTHVINFDLPTDASHYAHRAGRCGRGGRPGVVINMTSNPQERNVPQRFADRLGVDLRTVEVRHGKLNVVDPETQSLD